MDGVLDRKTVLAEYEGVRLGDRRLDRRLERILPQLLVAPGDSFPEQMESEADQEALYRFLGNSRVTMDALLVGHRQQTLRRMEGQSLVRVIHDTTEFVFDGDREGLSVVQSDDQHRGFLAHFALAVSADEKRSPLGILGVRPFIKEHRQRGLTNSQKNLLKLHTPRDEKKSSRWEKLALDVVHDLPMGVEAIHLMDQEADDFAIFSALSSAKTRFVIRVEANRKTDEGLRLDAVLAQQPPQPFRQITVARRTKKAATKAHPERAERVAELQVRVARVQLPRPYTSREAELSELAVQVVHVFEPSPPSGEVPIDWVLVTSEPVCAITEVEAVVDHYRARWVIEEYFKALKTGCAFERRQLTTLVGLLRALGLFVPMAWTLLALRNLGRDQPDRDARDLFTHEQLTMLRALLEKRRRRFAEQPTVRDAMLGIAALGGHIKNNGDPGWQVLGRGFRRFCEYEEAWNLARSM